MMSGEKSWGAELPAKKLDCFIYRAAHGYDDSAGDLPQQSTVKLKRKGSLLEMCTTNDGSGGIKPPAQLATACRTKYTCTGRLKYIDIYQVGSTHQSH